MGEKTPAQLGATSTPVLGTDLLVLYRGAGPMTKLNASDLKTYINTGTDCVADSPTDTDRIKIKAGGRIWAVVTGSPEGVLAASVGSMATRTDGGAGSTLYVKESGTGNTGWVAK
jgi:hypothetical protein